MSDATGRPDGWHDSAEAPPVERGTMREYVLAVYRERGGKIYSGAASYLNAYPIEYQSCPEFDCCDERCCEDGCPTTGWFTQAGDDNYSAMFNALDLRGGDKIMGWRELPDWNTPTHDAELERLREALEWYGENARLARLVHSGGDEGRRALADDGGKRARQALAPRSEP